MRDFRHYGQRGERPAHGIRRFSVPCPPVRVPGGTRGRKIRHAVTGLYGVSCGELHKEGGQRRQCGPVLKRTPLSYIKTGGFAVLPAIYVYSYFFLFFFGNLMAACAAASLAIGTLNGEQET